MNSILNTISTGLAIAVFFCASLYAGEEEQHWNQFRGPGGDGVSTATDLPVKFDEAKNVRWKTSIPGEGWSSPAIWGDEIWLTTGSEDKGELRAICVDLESGIIVKDIKVFDMIERKVDHAYVHDSPHLNSVATPTPVVEDEFVYVSFGSQGIACLDRETGDKVWQRRDLRVYQPVRQGSSPIVDDENLYVAFDGTDQQYFVALDKKTGDTRRKADRNTSTDWAATLRGRGLKPKKDGGGKPGDNKKSFATAQLIEIDGERQLIAPAAEATIAYDPDTGDELWRVMHPGGFNVAARPLHAHGMIYVFTSGLTGYLMGIRPDGRGDVTDTHVQWSTTRGTPEIPSPVVVGDLMFLVMAKGGVVRCLDAKTGKEIWKTRLGGDHWASPVYAAGKLYFSSKQGNVFVLPATREKPESIVKNQMNARFIASPAVAGASLILRSTTHLYCVQSGYSRSQRQVAADVYQTINDQMSPNRSVDSLGPKRSRSDRTTLGASTVRAESPGEDTDWDDAYEKLLAKSLEVKEKVDSGQATKEDVIAWMKSQRMKGGSKKTGMNKPGARAGSTNFYAIVIGRLRSKDIELGELEIDIDYVIGNQADINTELVGQRVKLVGVAGQFLDSLLQIKRGETIKVRTGDYNPKTKQLGFGYKFQVLERTPPFKPENFGVPPKTFRGFRGELTGKVVEAAGYEVLLEVSKIKPSDENEADDAGSIQGKRIRIAGFYDDHAEAFADLHEGDLIRVSVDHRNRKSDALDVTGVLAKVQE